MQSFAWRSWNFENRNFNTLNCGSHTTGILKIVFLKTTFVCIHFKMIGLFSSYFRSIFFKNFKNPNFLFDFLKFLGLFSPILDPFQPFFKNPKNLNFRSVPHILIRFRFFRNLKISICFFLWMFLPKKKTIFDILLSNKLFNPAFIFIFYLCKVIKKVSKYTFLLWSSMQLVKPIISIQ